ncbi:hypothetical protein AeMF1_010013 [Aphanomyces euteiches]|nr:hypothetical protein AeMF1_010013 [Aphanomyces euteiches]KAH9131517.1 hypothetical protein AeNC1_019576 [Aphanomyces euteiches]
MIYPSETVYGSLLHDPVKRRKDLATFDELDTLGFAFLSKNHFIRSGYRVHYSAKDCLLSLFQLHNETWNVWIHVIGSLAFAHLALQTPWTPLDAAADAIPTWPIVACLVCIALCFTLSAIYHLMYVQSPYWAKVFLQFDFAGILLMMGAAVPMLYYTFYCDVFVRNLYVGMAFFGATGFCVSFTAAFRTVTSLRIAVFMVYMMLGPLLSSLPFNLPGVVFYASRFPERISPGRFDIWGSSHQWWHLCVVVAGILYYQQTLELHAWRSANPCV